MSTAPSSPLRLPNFNTRLFSPPPQLKFHPPPYLSITRASLEDPTPDNENQTETISSTSEDSFESKLSQVRLRYKSGTGKKAEARKTKKGKKETTGGAGVFLPPVALKEPVSEGLNVEFGFSPYSERVNGRIALLGLTALVLVEVATGKGVINYHTPSIVFIQVYFVAAVSALYLKYEKEKVSVWPNNSQNVDK